MPKKPLGWARCTDSVADVLRRGAWYPILEESPDGGALVLEVRQRQVRISRVDVSVRKEAPRAWSVVVRTGVLRPTLGGGKEKEVITTYAVCPECHERQDFTGRPPVMKCIRCGRESAVDWTETC